MVQNLNIISLNARGLGDRLMKRRDVFHYIREKKYNICCFQDIHSVEMFEKQILSEWGYLFRLF